MPYAEESLETYLADAASDKPAPGGGSVSALAGALGCAMSEMAANFTVGKKKFAAVEGRAHDCLTRLGSARRELLALVDADVRAYGGVGQAYGMPKATPEQSAERAKAIQAALLVAMDVPLRIVRQCCVAAEAAAELVTIANPNLITDVGVSAIIARAAAEAARLNVEVNLKYIKDSTIRDRTKPDVDESIARVDRCCQEVLAAVDAHLSK